MSMPPSPDPTLSSSVTVGALAASPPPTWRLSSGQLLAGRYRIESTLGQGGYGQVYRALDLMLGRAVALKSLQARRPSESAAAQAVFLQEARTIALLDHPHIVPIFDAGVEQGLVWMAMRLVEGSDLAAILKSDGPLEPDRVLRLLRQALDALEHAHRRSIVHRDIKPQNFLLDRADDGQERLWLTDFGIAKLISGGTDEYELSIAGTPCYMSPEQITGKRVDPRTDLFALGCVAYEALTGERAFLGTTYPELLDGVVHQQPRHLADLHRQHGDRLAAFVRRALSKSAEDRFPSARDAATHLEGPEGPDPSPRRGSWWPRLFRPRHSPWDGRNVLTAVGIEKAYTLRRKVLCGVDLTVPAGAIYALLGRNGCGKTTLIRTCIGLHRPDAGTVSVFGRNPHREGPTVLARLGYVPESLAVYEWMRVSELLQFLARFYPGTWDTACCYRLLERFKLPLDLKVRDLSRGMQTKVSLVAALAHRPELLVLDDPTLGLDAVVLEELVETLLETSRRECTTVLIASHNLEEMDRVATHAGVLDGGRMLFSDSIARLKDRIFEVRLTFRGDVPRLHSIDSFKPLQASGQTMTGLVLDTQAATLEQLQALRPESLQTRKLGLRELFVQLMR